VEMIGALKQMEAGRSAAEVGRELEFEAHGVCVEGEVWRDECGRGAAAKTAGG